MSRTSLALRRFADSLLFTVNAGVQNIQPATQQVASSLLGKYQQTLQVRSSPSKILTSMAMSALMPLSAVYIMR